MPVITAGCSDLDKHMQAVAGTGGLCARGECGWREAAVPPAGALGSVRLTLCHKGIKI